MDGFIQRVDWAEDGARVRLHQIDLRQIPSGMAQAAKDNPRTEVRDRCLTTLRSVWMPLQRRRGALNRYRIGNYRIIASIEDQERS